MQLAVLQTPLTPALQASVLVRQRRLHAQFRQVDPAGQLITNLDKYFVVYPTVFWPSGDSEPLVQHWEIAPDERVLDLCTGSGGGRISLGQASFGPVDRVQALATQAGFVIRLIGSEHVETELPRTYHAFQLTACRSARG
jgi:hypothetical protein